MEVRRLFAAPSANWKLVWSDEFNGNHLDSSKWSVGLPWTGVDGTNLDQGSNTINYISPQDVSVSGGMLHLLTRQQSVTAADGTHFDYTGGFINSDNKFQMSSGYVEMRAQIPTDPGNWPAFWMLSQSGWPPEDDVAEFITGQGLLHQGLAYGSRTSVHWDDTDIYNPLPTGFHTYGMEWGAGYQIFTMDGIITHVSRGSYVPTGPMFLLLNNAISGQFPPTAATSFPSSFDVDYVRVYGRTTAVEVQYGGFEGGALGPWIGANTASVTTDNPHSGSYALRLQGDGSAAKQTINGLSPNTTYVLTAYAAAADGNAVALGVNSYGGADVSTTTTSSAYVPLAVTFKTGPGSRSAVIYGLQSSGSGYAWIDDVAVQRAGTIQNAGFELRMLADWNSSGSAAVVAGHVHSGRFALEAQNTGDEAHQTIYGLSPDTTYRITAWARVGSIDGQASLAVVDEDGQQTAATSTSTRYKPLSVTVTTGPTSTFATIFCSKWGGTGPVWFDDVALAVVRTAARKA